MLTLAVMPGTVRAAADTVTTAPDPRFAVMGRLPPPPADVQDIKFREFVRLPVGPAGLEPTPRALALAGSRVRLVGYLARQADAPPGRLVLCPLPVELGDADESLSDDLPVTATFIHLSGPPAPVLPYLPGLLQFTGVFEVGPQDEPDGHVSSFRLQLDADDSAALVALVTAPAPRGP